MKYWNPACEQLTHTWIYSPNLGLLLLYNLPIAVIQSRGGILLSQNFSTTTDPHSLNVDIKFGKPPLSVTLASWFLKGVGTGIHLAQESSTFQKDWTKTYLGPVSQQNYLQYHIHCWLPSYFWTSINDSIHIFRRRITPYSWRKFY